MELLKNIAFSSKYILLGILSTHCIRDSIVVGYHKSRDTFTKQGIMRKSIFKHFSLFLSLMSGKSIDCFIRHNEIDKDMIRIASLSHD